MAYGGTVKSNLPPKVPRPPSLSQNDFTVKASSFAREPQQEATSPLSPEARTSEWHWPLLSTAGMLAFCQGLQGVLELVFTTCTVFQMKLKTPQQNSSC